jgi:prepilin-type N-terminal cleavage/methylation domain-containing protein
MKNKGFSLIEILLGLALFSMAMSTATVIMYSSLRSSRKAAAVAMAKSEGAYALGAMESMIKFATDISCPPGGNSVNVTRLNPGPTIAYTFDTVNHRIASNGAALTSSNVTVTVGTCPAIFSCSDKTVSICFEIDNASGVDVTDKAGEGGGIKFQSWATSRNQYQ